MRGEMDTVLQIPCPVVGKETRAGSYSNDTEKQLFTAILFF